MHRAPALQVQVVRSQWQLRWVGACAAVSCALLLVMLAQRPVDNLPGAPNFYSAWVWVAGTAGVSVILALRHWWSSPQGQLQWTGQAWYWSLWDDQVCSLRVQADFQFCMLLLRGDFPQKSRSQWLWLDRRDFKPHAWLALRRAAWTPPYAEPTDGAARATTKPVETL